MLREMRKAVYEGTPFDFFCIGSPKVPGDSVGPYIGTVLTELNLDYDVKVIGTMDSPIIVSNYYSKLMELRKGSYVVAVDACISENLLGYWDVRLGSLKPGAFNTRLKPIGHASILCYTASHFIGLKTVTDETIYSMVSDITTRLVAMFREQKEKHI